MTGRRKRSDFNDYQRRCKRCDNLYRGSRKSEICPDCTIRPKLKFNKV